MFVEALACGTPVIAFARGASPEVIADGSVGYLVNHPDVTVRRDLIIKKEGLSGLKEAVEKIYSLSDTEYALMRKKCRQHFEKNFTSIKMVDGYEEVYNELIKKGMK